MCEFRAADAELARTDAKSLELVSEDDARESFTYVVQMKTSARDAMSWI